MSKPSHRHKETGALVFLEGYDPADLEPFTEQQRQEYELAMLNTEIKAEAARRIEAISPQWRQTTDLREPSEAGATRFAAIDEVRAWSNLLEREAAKALSHAAVSKIHTKIEEI